MAQYLSELTTDFTSNVSIRGRQVWHSAISSPVGASFATVRVGAGSSDAPSIAFNSEASLGLYRSAASRLAVSYGQFVLPDGSSVQPGGTFASEVSLGFYRSAASVIRQSYGGLIGGDGSTILPAFGFASDASRGFYRSAASTIAITSGTTLNLRTGSVKVSWDTRANATGMSIGELAVVFQASGISLMFSSGASSYVLGQSTQSVAQA